MVAVNFRHDPTELALDPASSESLGIWRDEMDRAFPPLEIVPIGTSNFHAQYRSAGSADFQLSDIKASPHAVHRAPGIVSGQSFDFYKISYQVSGTGTMTQGDRELKLAPGAITVYDTARKYDLHFEEDFRFIVAMFPKRALDLPAGLAGEFAAYPLDGTTGTGAVLSTYLLGLVDNLEHLATPSGERLARTGLDLITSVLNSELDDRSEHANSERSILIEMTYFINDHLQDWTLSPDMIAAAHYISTRHLYNIFKSAGVSVAQWIKQRRLTEARRDLADPLLSQVSISSIAHKWCFDDPAYFSRVFRELFELSPSEWRTRAEFSRTYSLSA
ncbi:MAG: hypothetical protein RLZZ600_1007 [Actinomycetota bacterium]